MAERSLLRRLNETRPLQDKSSPRNKKRKELLGPGKVASQNRAALAAKTDKAATRATINRVADYRKAKRKSYDSPLAKAVRNQKRKKADKKSAAQFAKRQETKKHKF